MDVLEALLCAVRLFHYLHKDGFVMPLQQDLMGYCYYVSAFIGGVWLNRVRTLTNKEFKAKKVSDIVISRYKTRVCNNLRIFLPR